MTPEENYRSGAHRKPRIMGLYIAQVSFKSLICNGKYTSWNPIGIQYIIIKLSLNDIDHSIIARSRMSETC